MPVIEAKTAKTKVCEGAHLFSRTIKSGKDEQVIVLMNIDGRAQAAEQLMEEWMRIVDRTMLHTEENAYDRLEGALKELNGLLKGMLMTENLRDVSGILAVCEGSGGLHLSAAGRAEGYLTRSGSTVVITEHSGTGKDLPHFLHISSGDLEPNDVVTLSTTRLLRTLAPAQLSQLARDGESYLESVRNALDAEKEVAVLTSLRLSGAAASPLPADEEDDEPVKEKAPTQKAKDRPPASSSRQALAVSRKGKAALLSSLSAFTDFSKSLSPHLRRLPQLTSGFLRSIRRWTRQLLADLQHPTRKHRAHLLLLASTIVVFIAIWAAFQVSSNSARSQSRTELEALIEKINQDIRTSENRRLMGDLDAANTILDRAEQEAKNVMENENGLFRTDALDMLNRIREKREEVNNIVRISPSASNTVNLSAKNPDISARGIIGTERGRMLAFDRQNLYPIIVNSVEDPVRLDGENIILDGAYFERFKTSIFMTKENRLIELIDGQPTAMKTDDPGGWLSGPDMETYNRFLYLLSPQNNQIYKYERLGNRYSSPTEYNVNGNLQNAIDMAIDSDLYVLLSGGGLMKMLRGEEQKFTIRNLPANTLTKATKILKPSDQGNFYFMDPEGRRIIITRKEDDLGESMYLQQYLLEGEDIGVLQDIYVGPDESQLYVLDEKKLYIINLQEGAARTQ